MRHRDRRKELGKMLMDVSRYLLTVGLISGLIADKLKPVFIATIAAVVGFYIIPEVTEDK